MGLNGGDDDDGNNNEVEVEDLQFENDEMPRNQVAGGELPLEGDAKAKLSKGDSKGNENPELEIPAHKDGAELI